MRIKKNKLFGIKQPFIYIVSAISIFLIFLLGVWSAAKVNAGSFSKRFGGNNGSLTSTSGTVKIDEQEGQPIKIWKEVNGQKVDDFKILSISDTHFRDEGTDFCLDVLDQYIEQEKPDLVVLNGDNIYCYTELKFVNELVTFFEERNQYWTFVLGNHDGQGWAEERDDPNYWWGREKAFNRESGVEQGIKHDHCLARCLASDESDPSKYGYGTNRIDVLGTGSEPLQTLLFFDCMTIDHQNDDVRNWLREQIENNSGDIIAFNHKPFYEMEEGYNKIGTDSSVVYTWGKIREKIANDGDKNGLFEVFVANSNKNPLLVFGHDHINNLRLSYKGVDMMYTLGLQYNTYNSRTRLDGSYVQSNWVNIMAYALDNSVCTFIDGATEYVIHNNQPREISNLYAQFSGVLDGLKTRLNYLSQGFLTYDIKGFTISLQILLPISAIAVIGYWVEFGRYWYKKNHKKQLKRKSAK